MDLGIRGRVAMVAAGTKGIGLACARALLAEGCRVGVCSRTEENLVRAKAELPELHAFRCDVTRAEDLDAWHAAVRAELGEPDILVTNTGGPPAGPLSQMTDEQWLAGVDATLMNVVRLVRLAAPGMAARKWGRIV
ncbi:MAG: SDR family NAD(P)-dependent oxidoreductase, partial [Fimbriimonadaceae bacterium]